MQFSYYISLYATRLAVRDCLQYSRTKDVSGLVLLTSTYEVRLPSRKKQAEKAVFAISGSGI